MIDVWQGILVLVALAFLAVASFNDLKKREVSDWLSYGLIFSGLGLRAIFSLEEGWLVFLDGLLGLLVCLGIAYLFYYTNQWGGGDSKLLMGMGGIIGLGIGEGFGFSRFDFSLLWFFLALLLFGALSGLGWSLFLVIKRWGKFVKEFKSSLAETKKWHYAAWLVSLGFFVLGFFNYYVWPLAVLPITGFYLFCFAKVMEEEFMVRKVEVNQLVEGDQLAKEVWIGREKIAEEKKELGKEELGKLLAGWRKGKIKKVWLREGIPFVPSFLLAYLALVFSLKL